MAIMNSFGFSDEILYRSHRRKIAFLSCLLFIGLPGSLLSCNVNNTIKGSYGSGTSKPQFPLPQNLAVETKSNGTGQRVEKIKIVQGQSIDLFSVLRNQNGEYISQFASSWSLNSTIGSLQVLDGNKSAKFVANTLGVGSLEVTGMEQKFQITIEVTESEKPVLSFSKSQMTLNETEGILGNSSWATGMNSWTYRRRVFLNWKGGNISNFPVMIKLNSSNINYSEFKADGSDLRLFDSDNSTVLEYEIDVWNPAGDSILWVLVPTIESTGLDFIWLYHGNPSASSVENPSTVWMGPGALGVWHFSDLTDSTSQAMNMTNSGTTLTTGPVGPARSFNGSSNYLSIADSSSVPGGLAEATICALAKSNATGGATPATIFSYGTATNTAFAEFGGIENIMYGGFGTTNQLYSFGPFLNTTDWNHYCLELKGSTYEYSLYLNGNFLRKVENFTISIVKSLMEFGRSVNASSYWNGDIDEVRFYPRKDTNFLKLEYLSLTNQVAQVEERFSKPLPTSQLKVQLSRPLDHSITVSYSTTGTGSLVSDLDFPYSSGSLTFASGETEKVLDFSVKNDDITEGDETISLNLQPHSDLTLSSNNTFILSVIERPGSTIVASNDSFTVRKGLNFLDVLANDSKPGSNFLQIGSVTNGPSFGTYSILGGELILYPQ